MNTNEAPLTQNQLFVKIALCLILMSFAYHFYFSLSPLIDGDDDHQLPSPLTTDSGSMECDVFTGEWVMDRSGPRYTNHSCNTIEPHQNCMKNGRPDSNYIYWRWTPSDCHLPTFDPTLFLHYMTNKTMAFVGDSISRNHVQSLLCIISQVEEAVEVYHDDQYKSKRWLFRSHNFTLSVIWSPFLTKAKISEDNDGHSSGAVQLHLDELDPVWVNESSKSDYMIIAGGKWFLKTTVYYENNTIIGCHNCNQDNTSEVTFKYAYQKALHTALDFIARSNHTVFAFLRTMTPDHFEDGEWDSGGYCNRTGPFKDGEIEMRDIDRIMREIELEEFESAKEAMNMNGSPSVLRLFDTSGLSLLRPDGHPGPYRVFHPNLNPNPDAKVQNDCLHWCLPGPIDSWNDIMLNLLLRG